MLPVMSGLPPEGASPNDVHDAREIVGEHVQGHLGRNQTLHQKVGCPHPHLEWAKGMFRRLTPQTQSRPTARKKTDGLCYPKNRRDRRRSAR
jgi:hypothetical protein